MLLIPGADRSTYITASDAQLHSMGFSDKDIAEIRTPKTEPKAEPKAKAEK